MWAGIAPVDWTISGVSAASGDRSSKVAMGTSLNRICRARPSGRAMGGSEDPPLRWYRCRLVSRGFEDGLQDV